MLGIGRAKAFGLSVAPLLPQISFIATIGYVALRDVVLHSQATTQYAYWLTHSNIGNSTDFSDARMPVNKSYISSISNPLFGSTAFYAANIVTSITPLAAMYATKQLNSAPVFSSMYNGNPVKAAFQLSIPFVVNVAMATITYITYRSETEHNREIRQSSRDIENDCSGFEEQPRTTALINTVTSYQDPTNVYKFAEWGTIVALMLGAFNHAKLFAPALAAAEFMNRPDNNDAVAMQYAKHENRVNANGDSSTRESGGEGDQRAPSVRTTTTASRVVPEDGAAARAEEEGPIGVQPLDSTVATAARDGGDTPAAAPALSGGEDPGLDGDGMSPRGGAVRGSLGGHADEGDAPGDLSSHMPSGSSISTPAPVSAGGTSASGRLSHDSLSDGSERGGSHSAPSMNIVKSIVTALHKGFNALDALSLASLLPFGHFTSSEMVALASHAQYNVQDQLEKNIANAAVVNCIPRIAVKTVDGALVPMNPKTYMTYNWNCTSSDIAVNANGELEMLYAILAGNCTDVA